MQSKGTRLQRPQPFAMRTLISALVLCTLSQLASLVRAQVGANPSLALEDVIEIARAQHPSVRAATSLADAADQRPSIVRRPADPVVFLSIDHLPTSLDGVSLSGGVQVTAPLGRVLRNRRRAAEADAAGTHTQIDVAVLDVELEAVMSFLKVRYARGLGEVLRAQALLMDELVAAASARYASGTGSQADVLRAQAERARVGASIRTVEGLLEAAEGMLNAALGRRAGTPIPTLDEPSFGPPPSLEEALRRALDTRPELDAQRSFIERASAEVAVMRGMYRPMLMTQIGGAYTMADGPGVMAMVGFSVPIWRDRVRASVSEARAMRAMLESELDAMRLMVEGEIASAHGDAIATDARLESLRTEVLPLARQALEANLAQYAAARVPLVSPIEAARMLFSVESELLMAEMERGMARARLGRALGRTSEAW